VKAVSRRPGVGRARSRGCSRPAASTRA
jgi:hypothetical protein